MNELTVSEVMAELDMRNDEAKEANVKMNRSRKLMKRNKRNRKRNKIARMSRRRNRK